MKNALRVLLLSLPIALLWYSPKALVPAVDAKNLLVRAVLAIASVLLALLFASDKKFRSEAVGKLHSFWKNPLGKAVTASFIILMVSTVFAFSPYVAFFGTAARGEGLVGLTFFYFLTLSTVIIFEKKDWLTFWKVMIYAGGIVFIKQLMEFFGGAFRPGSLMDNPIFLAGYFLVIIYAGLLLFGRGLESKNDALKWTGISGVVMAILGIFITESRGVMLGVAVGTIVAFTYIMIKSAKDPAHQTARKIAVTILSVVILVGGVFALTRHSNVWTHIPGFNRLAQFSLTDSTTLSRIENAKLTLRAVRPSGANIKNTFIGWGWDNYVFAWQTNYNPTLYQYDRGIFDRAHNKLLDVLVMNGVLGLLAYLALWVFIFRSALYIGRHSIIEGAAVLFFGSAFFIQNLFVFDTVISYLPFFALIGYMIFETQKKYE